MTEPDTAPTGDEDPAPDEPDLGELPDAVDDPAEAVEGAAIDEDEDPGEAQPDDPYADSDGTDVVTPAASD